MPAKIFINYRRDDDPSGAARIRDGLAKRFGQSNVFMDVDNLLVGQKFHIELAKALEACDIFIAVIGARWLQLLKERQNSGEEGLRASRNCRGSATRSIGHPCACGP